jgi:hypothetical protein
MLNQKRIYIIALDSSRYYKPYLEELLPGLIYLAFTGDYQYYNLGVDRICMHLPVSDTIIDDEKIIKKQCGIICREVVPQILTQMNEENTAYVKEILSKNHEVEVDVPCTYELHFSFPTT